MTTNARGEQWSEWIHNKAGLCPVEPGTHIEYKMDKHGTAVSKNPERLRWSITGDQWSDIIAYRYKIEESESDMHPDLEWLARNVSEWPNGAFRITPRTFGVVICIPERWVMKNEWLQARKDLGLEPSGISEIDEEECIQLAYERMNQESVPTSIKQLRYQDAKGEDWIDEFARTASVDEFRGAMKFSIGKYNRRAGKKDELIKEIEKMRDYCDRWIDYERSL